MHLCYVITGQYYLRAPPWSCPHLHGVALRCTMGCFPIYSLLIATVLMQLLAVNECLQSRSLVAGLNRTTANP